MAGQNTLYGGYRLQPQLFSLCTSPAFILFVSANSVNVGNLAFNVVFSRLLGPELFSDLAFILTIKLSILSVLSAVQFELARRVANLKTAIDMASVNTQAKHLTRKSIIFGWVLMGIALILGLLTHSADIFQSTSPFYFSLLIFAISLPVIAPLCLERGLAQGTLDLPKIIASSQIEMLVRFGGGATAWFFGFGLPGVVFAIVLSIYAGWYFAKAKTKPESFCCQTTSLAVEEITNRSPQSILNLKSILVATIPWACLQLSQVLILDGEFLVAKFLLGQNAAGELATTALLQRIIFFGFFGLATALIPLAASINSRSHGTKVMLPAVLLYVVGVIPLTSFAFLCPELAVTTLFGSQYLGASSAIGYAVASASVFVFSYLSATVLISRSESRFAYLLLAFAFVQLAAIAALTAGEYLIGIQNLAAFKLCFQLIIAGIFVRAGINEYYRLPKR